MGSHTHTQIYLHLIIIGIWLLMGTTVSWLMCPHPL